MWSVGRGACEGVRGRRNTPKCLILVRLNMSEISAATSSNSCDSRGVTSPDSFFSILCAAEQRTATRCKEATVRRTFAMAVGARVRAVNSQRWQGLSQTAAEGNKEREIVTQGKG